MPEDEEEHNKAIGPKCAVCGKSTDSLYPILLKREIRIGFFEMVLVYLCAYHYANRLEVDANSYTDSEDEEENDIMREWREFMGPDNGDDDEEEEDDNGEGWGSDRAGQSWG